MVTPIFKFTISGKIQGREMPVGAAIVIAAVAGIPVIIIIIALIRSCNRSHHPDTRVSPVCRSLVKSGHR